MRQELLNIKVSHEKEKEVLNMLLREYEEIFGEIEAIKLETLRYNKRLDDDTALLIAKTVVIESRAQGIDPGLVSLVIAAESSFRPQVVSPCGAQGLMQLMPATARSLGVEDPFNIAENIRSGITYLANQKERFGDVTLALAAYNAGPGNVIKYGGVPPFSQTRAYVSKIARGLEV